MKNRKHKQTSFLLVTPLPTFTVLDNQLKFFYSIFKSFQHLAPYTINIPKEAVIIKLFLKNFKGKLRVIAKLFNIKETKKYPLVDLLLVNRALLLQVILAYIKGITLRLEDIKNISYLILLKQASIKLSPLILRRESFLLILQISHIIWVPLSGFYICIGFFYSNFTTSTYLYFYKGLSIPLIILAFLLQQPIRHASLTLLFRKKFINIFYTHFSNKVMLDKRYSWLVTVYKNSSKCTINLNQYNLDIKYFFDSLMTNIEPYLSNIYKMSLSTTIVRPDERFNSEFYLGHLRAPYISINAFRKMLLNTYRGLNLDDYYSTAYAQDFTFRITFKRFQPLSLENFTMPLIIEPRILRPFDNPYDFDIV